MSTPQRKKMHFLSLLHVLAVLALICWWGAFFWQHTPARALLHRVTTNPHTHAVAIRRMTHILEWKVGAIEHGLDAALGDIVFGLITIAQLAIGTGVYVRRLEIWLQARSSGQAVALGTTDLPDAALAANAEKEGLLT